MDEITFRTGHVATTEQVRSFFEYLFDAEEGGDEFPVDFEAVWPMAYARKDIAKRALIESDEFFEGVDYQLRRNADQTSRMGRGAANKEEVYLSVACFEFFIARKVRPIFEVYRQCRIEVTKQAKAKARLPYHLRRYLANHDRVPEGYFSVLQEVATKLVGPMEIGGYTIAHRNVPDISVGQVWSNHLRNAKGVDPHSFPTYEHKYEDGRVVEARLYPNALLPEFVALLQGDWIGNRAEKYFRDRDVAAIPFIPRRLRPPA